MPAAQRREQIIEVATRVFARAGYGSASTAEIANEAGISEPTIYRHFESKQALYLAVIAATTDTLVGAWTRIAAENEDALTGLARMSAWYQQQLSVKPELLEFRFRSIAATEEPPVKAAVRDGYRKVIRLVRAQFERAKAQGRLPKALDPLVPTTLFIALGALTDVIEHLDLGAELGDSFPAAAFELSALFRAK